MGSDGWSDPYGIVPRSFRNNYPNADSVREALDHAERLPSSTPPGERPTCPECGSVGISPIGTGQGEGSANDWKCNECEHRFNNPDKPDMDRYDHTAHLRFNFLDDGDLKDPDRRTELDPPLADLDREELVEAVIRLYRPWSEDGPALADIARFVPYERYWVGERNREWERGDHRDLVPDPTAEPEPDPSPDSDPPIDPSVVLARIGGDYEELVAERTEAPSDETDTAPEAAADGGTRRSRWAAYGRG